MSRARAHHYVPQSYLLGWANPLGRVAVRRRGRELAYVAATKRVAQETDLHTIETLDGPSDAVEGQLSQWEGHLPRFLSAMRQAMIPVVGTPDRALFASLLALQYIRTPDRMEFHRFSNDALVAADGERPVPRGVIGSLLTDRWGYPPTSEEVQSFWDWTNGSLANLEHVTYGEFLSIQFSTLPEVAAALASKRWSIEVTKGRVFIASDQPVSLWLKRPSALQGVGVVDADEIRFPVGPRHLLVLRPKGREGSGFVTRARVEAVNQEAAATCRQMVIGRPIDTSYLESILLRDRRPMWKIDEASGYRTGRGGDQYLGEILHSYRPYDDRPVDEYPRAYRDS